MKPKAKPRTHEQPLIATMRLDLALDLDHELVRLSGVIPWDALAGEFGPLYCADNGRPAVPIRLMSLAVTHKEGFVVGIPAFPDNPCDGHTLDGQLDQVERLTGKVPEITFVDRGYKGHGIPTERSRVLISGTRRLSYAPKRHLRRRAAVEPEIGHMKNDGLLAGTSSREWWAMP